MLKGIVFTIFSIVVWIARKSGEDFGYKKAIKEIEKATEGKLLTLQGKIKERQDATLKTHAGYEKTLPDVWPSDGVIKLHQHQNNPSVTDETTSADLLDPRD